MLNPRIALLLVALSSCTISHAAALNSARQASAADDCTVDWLGSDDETTFEANLALLTEIPNEHDTLSVKANAGMTTIKYIVVEDDGFDLGALSVDDSAGAGGGWVIRFTGSGKWNMHDKMDCADQDPTLIPTAAPSPVPSPAPSPGPTLIPTAAPSPKPSPVPSPQPTHPSPAPSLKPTNAPTNLPTTSDTVSIAVSFMLAATSDPTSDDKITLKTTIASSLDIEEGYLKGFSVSSQATARRWLRRSLLASYTWSVAFTVTVPLSGTSFDSATSLSAGVESALTSDPFVAAVSSSVGATVDVTSVSSEITTTRTTQSDDENETSTAAVALFAILGVLVCAATAAAFFFRMRFIKDSKTESSANELGDGDIELKVKVEKSGLTATKETTPKAGSVLEFLLFKAKLSNKRALILAEQFAEQGYGTASDFQGMTEVELSDEQLRNVVGFLLPEMRKFRAAVVGLIDKPKVHELLTEIALMPLQGNQMSTSSLQTSLGLDDSGGVVESTHGTEI